MILHMIKFLWSTFFAKDWTTEVTLKRLDRLKTTLINYYAKENLFGPTNVNSGRDKGIGFPSLEGALLSLAFLTFSVFLIDLIQTLLARLRISPASPAPAVALGRSLSPPSLYNASIPAGQRNDEEVLTTLSSKVLSAIEKPLFGFH